MSLGLLLALALTGQADVAAPAAADPAPTTTTTAAAVPREGARSGATGDPNRRICRSQGATGSRIGSARICKSAREWEEQRIAAKTELDRHQRTDGTNF